MLNRSKQIVVDPLEELDDEEKLAVLTDIMNSEAMKSEVLVQEKSWAPVLGFGKKPTMNTVGPY